MPAAAITSPAMFDLSLTGTGNRQPSRTLGTLAYGCDGGPIPQRRLHADDAFALESLVDAITFRVTRALLDDSLRADLDGLRDDLVWLTLRLCPWLEGRGHRG